MTQLGTFDLGQIKAHRHHGLSALSISQILVKPGTGPGTRKKKEFWTEGAIQQAIWKLEEDPSWRGERQEGSGAPRKTTAAQDKALYNYVVKPGRRGEEKVTVKALRKHFQWTRGVSDTLLEERLYEAGLRWLRRRGKTVVTSIYLRDRVAYCHRVLRLHNEALLNWAYTDGTTFFIDRTAGENEQSQRAALGPFVWRHADHRDCMFQECLGPST